MRDFDRQMERLRLHTETGWTETHAELLLVQTHTRLRRRRRAIAAGGAGAALLGVAAVALLVAAPRRPAEVAARVQAGPAAVAPGSRAVAAGGPPVGAGGPAVAYVDGSRAEPIAARTELRIVEQSGRRTTTQLDRGAARFDVSKNPARRFAVVAGPVSVVALGTVFTVERGLDGVWVAVEEGRVRVTSSLGSADLRATERRIFPLAPSAVAEPPAAAVPPAAAAVVPPPPAAAELPPPVAAAPLRSSRSSAAVGGGLSPQVRDLRPARIAPGAQEERAAAAAGPATRPPALAPVAPPPQAPPPATGPVDALLAAADAARDRGSWAEAAALLEQIAWGHPRDAGAPLAAFSAGRLSRNALGRPRQAAALFARARALAPAGPLAEDALAREVDSWTAAGDAARARARAEEYLRRYPNGRWIGAVRAAVGSP